MRTLLEDSCPVDLDYRLIGVFILLAITHAALQAKVGVIFLLFCPTLFLSRVGSCESVWMFGSAHGISTLGFSSTYLSLNHSTSSIGEAPTIFSRTFPDNIERARCPVFGVSGLTVLGV